MEKFKPTVISKEFVAAATDAIQNQNALSFTDSVASSAVLSDDQAMNNNYQKSQGYSRDVTGVVTGYKNADTNTIVANVKISNQSLSADVKISTVMIFASYNGNKILVATSRLNNPELLPAFDSDKGTPVTIELAVYIQVSDVADANVQFNDAGLATNTDLQRVDSSAVHNTGDEKVDGVKTFVQPIKGVADINVRKLWDGYDLDGLKSAGMYAANNVKVLQSAVSETFSLIVEVSGSAVKQTKSVFNSDGTNSTYVRYFSGTWSAFKLVPMDDSQVVHNNSDGTINGKLKVNGDLTTTAGTNFNSLWVNNSSYLNGPTFISGNTAINKDLTVNGAIHGKADSAGTADTANTLNSSNSYQVTGIKTTGFSDFTGPTNTRDLSSFGILSSFENFIAKKDAFIDGNLKVGGAIHGKADSASAADNAGRADKAGYADSAGTANALNSNNGYQVNGLQTNGSFKANAGASVVGNLDVSGDTSVKSVNAQNYSFARGGLEVSNGFFSNQGANFKSGINVVGRTELWGSVYVDGDLYSKRSSMRTVPTPTGMTLLFHRVGNGVMVTAYGESKPIGQFSPIGVGIPVGFRPPVGTHATLYNGYTGGTIAFFETGTIYAGAEDIGGGTSRMHAYWHTLDGWPD